MSADLNETLDVGRLRDRSIPLAGTLSTQRMRRLREAGTPADHCAVDATLQADQRGNLTLVGRFETTIEMQCQRCLELVGIPLRADVDLVIADGDAPAADDMDPADRVELDDGILRLAQLAEEELLLSLPVVPRHEDGGECRAGVYTASPPGEPVPERENPFAVLKGTTRRDDH